MLTIYGVYRSRTSRPLWLLDEIGMNFNHLPVIQAYRLPDASAADAPFNTRSEEFLVLNPLGQIPVMEDDGLVLTESLAITQHLARKYGGMLGPQNAAEEALIGQWSLTAATAVEGCALEILQTLANGGADTPEGQAQISICAEKLRRPFAVLERHLGGHEWLVGDRFTVADLNMAECIRYAQGVPALIAEFPKLQRWLLRCQDRDAFKAMMTAREAEPA
ncbi:glutathione S-transferase family protein [Falsirhodobacter deserti]|uniref:glutathione S-transferase family protein n=1 Tax=Falsirhodobacter deserti TaxID=1365611 RepID=UPI000FE4331D|nr:glutathione S-transferase family protein [Falsirhodobacter deserti]